MASRPLVSVLIRTLGRATLARSVAAALAQTHRPLEIVVVNAGAKPLPPLPAPVEVEIRVVDGGPYDRSRPADAALANAKGEWLVFLDDDDAFAPGHVESLLASAELSGGARVAYSATAAVEPDGSAKLVIGCDFDRLNLFIGNYMQIGAALFSASLVAEGARFDEAIECFEDWDFLIQLAQRTHFVYTGKPTNHWYAYAGESGAGLGANKREEATRPFHELVVRKWAERAATLREKVQHHERAARQAAARREPRYEHRHLAEAA
ncbi:MAG: glycosyltransferase, partial [Burkholderiales bacterium]|nr:glycosyltransferase [Burkholderiales bacterium]